MKCDFVKRALVELYALYCLHENAALLPPIAAAWRLISSTTNARG